MDGSVSLHLGLTSNSDQYLKQENKPGPGANIHGGHSENIKTRSVGLWYKYI